MEIAIVNGPNLNLLGQREIDIYGKTTFEDYFESLKKIFSEHQLLYFQSNHEGEIIDFLHEKGFTVGGIVLNPGGFTHTSVALADAVAAVSTVFVEVHISNIFAREAFRNQSYISPNVMGVISGMGLDGYRLAVDHLVSRK